MGLITLLIQATLTGNVTHFRPAENFNNLTNPKWRHIACEQASPFGRVPNLCSHAFALQKFGGVWVVTMHQSNFRP